MRTKKIDVHIHDPGRLKELLFPGNKILLRRAKSKARKTKWDLVASYYDGMWVVTNSSYHRVISETVLRNKEISPFKQIKNIEAEKQYDHSRLDFRLETKKGRTIWLEVKGCTLTVDQIALFPDAPTVRGSKHLEALISAKQEGFEASMMFLIFRPDSKCFAPNIETDPKFSNLFNYAIDAGVDVHPLLFKYVNGIVYFVGKIPLCNNYPKI